MSVLTRRAIHVVAGILMNGEQIFLSRRRPDAHQGGKWEFPGGKLNPHETPYAGLVRELKEELGIDVQAARPFVRVSHTYPDINVLLDVWRVSQYRGEPLGRESQEVEWFAVEDLRPSEFPEADRPILRRLQLPPLYLISDTRRYGETGFLTRLERALAAGVRLVQLREPHLDRSRFVAYAREVARRCRAYKARLLINAAPDWIAECEADGAHLNSARLMTLPARPIDADGWLAASCHSAEELAQAQRIGVDFAVLGPVKVTASHPERVPMGWEAFARLSETTHVPLYALGGIAMDDFLAATAAGAHGIAGISGFWDRKDLDTQLRSCVRYGAPI
jgi:8-oxo-dGTP diphosphatase